MHNILIVGGGMVGATLALALLDQTPCHITVLEANDHKPNPERVSAFSLSSQRIFKSLQVWQDMLQAGVSDFTRIHVWEENKKQALQFDSHALAAAQLGFIIENDVVLAALRKRLLQHPRMTWVSPVTLTAFQETNDGVLLQAANGEVYRGKLAVAADGAQSWLRRAASISIKKQDYAQRAIVTTVHTSRPHKKIARQIFLKQGVLAHLPLKASHASSIVWSLPDDLAATCLAWDDATFKQQLAQAFEYRLGDVVQINKRFAFPLCRQTAAQYVKPRLALMGDAAHIMHPLAGQGVNMGLLDAASLAEVIADAMRLHRDFSSLATLRRYERWRKADNATLLTGVDVIKQLFASNAMAMSPLRSFGLKIMDQLAWAKNTCMHQAVGVRQGLPELATNNN